MVIGTIGWGCRQSSEMCNAMIYGLRNQKTGTGITHGISVRKDKLGIEFLIMYMVQSSILKHLPSEDPKECFFM